MSPIRVNQSDEIKDLIAALAKAQAVMKPAIINKKNPFFKTMYADFTSCMDACRGPLSDNGLAIIQSCETINGELNLVTMLAHTSGQWLKSDYPIIPAKKDSQGIGAAMTYAKRYSLCGMIGIVADEDDDGNATVVNHHEEQKQPLKPSTVSFDQALELQNIFSECSPEIQKTFMGFMNKEMNFKSLSNVTIDKFDYLKKILIKKKSEVQNASANKD